MHFNIELPFQENGRMSSRKSFNTIMDTFTLEVVEDY